MDFHKNEESTSGSHRSQFPEYHRGNNDYLTRKDKNEIEHEIRQHLSKRYDLDDDYLYVLPTVFFSDPPWKEESLQSLKNDLNSVKSKLNNYDLERWHAHTTNTNFAGFVIPAVRKFKPELLTQAWCAFIAALNHNLTLNYPHIKWEWRANTLNPYYEGNPLQRMINDDRFVMKTSDNWIFGEDFTGNICQRVNLEHLKRTSKDIGPIHLVTADGSFDCTDDPAEQEGKVVPLLYCETIAAFSILAPGGSFVLKIFTIFECQTVCLLYLLRCSFKKVCIYKPTVSKEGNSELYVVCLGFIKNEHQESLLNELSKRMEDAATGMVMFRKEDVNAFFISEMERCSSFFTGIQMTVIERNIQLFQEGFSSKDRKILNRIKKSISELYVENFCIRPLPDDGYMLGKQAYYKRGLHFSPRDDSGTFADRQYLKDTDSSAILEYYKSKLNGMHFYWPCENDILWLEDAELQAADCAPEIFVKRGKPFKTILSSRFCTGNLLTVFNDVLNNTTPVISYDFWAESFTSFFSSSSSMNCLAYNEFKMVDVRDKPWISDYHVAQTESLRALCSVLLELKKGSNFVFIGLPLLTQFNVGLVFLLARNFKKVGFPYPREFGNCIVFQDLQSNDFSKLIDVLKEGEGHPNQALISLIDITALGDEYLKTVTLFNQVLLRKTSLIMAHDL
ncbi:hypothetical protein GE061_019361 [Apolygus lucorum]|uniref:Cap-specific mRNA (nucleoside-2'-O-)-methyltransferase 2 n=1 Tax=Apolygus lucorum TaxID=248454 RepID=A0A8S9X9L4_APOLU|nr:hypothetical protein GE061_019361 [Apolygus lucorum]